MNETAVETVVLLLNIPPYQPADSAMAWLEKLKAEGEREGLHYYVVLPFDLLSQMASTPLPPPIVVGAPYLLTVKADSFAGPIATQLLVDSGAKFVLIGERRSLQLGEKREEMCEKIKGASLAGLMPILCIGETAEEYSQGQTEEVLQRQLQEATFDLDSTTLSTLQVVYEAPWVDTLPSRPSPEEIDRAYQRCRKLVHQQLGDSLTSKVKVYCPVPVDLMELPGFIHTIHADGFYLREPQQMAAFESAQWGKQRLSKTQGVIEAEEAVDKLEKVGTSMAEEVASKPIEKSVMAAEEEEAESEKLPEAAPVKAEEETEGEELPEAAAVKEAIEEEAEGEELPEAVAEEALVGGAAVAEGEIEEEEATEEEAKEAEKAPEPVKEEPEALPKERGKKEVKVSNISTRVAETRKKKQPPQQL